MAIFPRSQAPMAVITRTMRRDRAADELIGLCRGILADGALNISEAQFLQDWIVRQREFAHHFPFNVLMTRIAQAMDDGVLDDEDERDLLECLSRFVGGESHALDAPSASLATDIPTDHPAPMVEFGGNSFVVTGVFAFGSRAEVVAAIAARGGSVDSSVLKRSRYLVIGEVGSRDWKHSSFGRKIETAINLRDEGHPIAIINEAHWRASLGEGGAA